MSFILDALEKADKKRKAGAVPDLQTMHGQPKSKAPHKKWWPYLAVGLLLMQTAGVTTWMLLKPGHEDAGEKSLPAPATPAPAIISPPAARPAGIAPQQPVVIVLKESVSPSAASPPATPAQTPSFSTAQQSVPAEKEIPPPQAELIAEEALETAGPTQADHPADAVAGPESMEDMEPPPMPVSREEIVLRESAMPPTMTDDTQERNSLPDISELPSAIRGELPDVSISYHAYANNPASRLVSINGRIVRQGQEAGSGLLVEEITSAGVVLKYKSHRFRMNVF